MFPQEVNLAPLFHRNGMNWYELQDQQEMIGLQALPLLQLHKPML